MKVYVDQGVDQKKIKKLKQLYGFEAIYHQSLEQPIKVADAVPGVFVLDQSTLDGGDYLAGCDITDFQMVIGKSNKQDRLDTAHLYTAIHASCDFFITNNPDSFIYDDRKNKDSDNKRIELEKLTEKMKIVRLEEFEKILNRDMQLEN